jgi:hypothetical protein
VDSSSTGRASRGGTGTVEPLGRRKRSWPRTNGCVTTSKNASPGRSARPMGHGCRDPGAVDRSPPRPPTGPALGHLVER